MTGSHDVRLKELYEKQQKQDAELQTCSTVLDGIKLKFSADLASMNEKFTTVDSNMALLSSQMEQLLAMHHSMLKKDKEKITDQEEQAGQSSSQKKGIETYTVPHLRQNTIIQHNTQKDRKSVV